MLASLPWIALAAVAGVASRPVARVPVRGVSEFHSLLAQAGPNIGLGYSEIAAVSVQATPYLRGGRLYGIEWDEVRDGVVLEALEPDTRASRVFVGGAAPRSLQERIEALTARLRLYGDLEPMERTLDRFFDAPDASGPLGWRLSGGQGARFSRIDPQGWAAEREDFLAQQRRALPELAADVGVAPESLATMGLLELLEFRSRVMLADLWTRDPDRRRRLEEAGVSADQFRRMTLRDMRKTLHKLGVMLRW